MKKIIICLLVLFGTKNFAQVTGDTIVVKTFKYGSATRDTAIQFPSNSTTYEKIIMRYNMRCKNGLVSTSSQRNLGCGEWDYSCNTYIADSSRIENSPQTAPNYIISNFTGTVFPYTTLQPYDYYNYSQTSVTLNSITSETQYTIGSGAASVPNFLKTNEKSGRSQLLYTAAELTSVGFTAGNIDGLILDVANAGGTANFLNLSIQHTTLTALSSSSVTLTGFANVFNSNYTFVNGNNRIQFYTPFTWNGIDNLIIDCSFTNSNPGTPIIFNGVTTPSVNALYANNNYAVDLEANGHININSTFLNTISNEITVSFWAYGDKTLMPANTSILYGWAANPNDRTLNIDLPWSDNNIYFDCGFSAGGYDRTNKVSTAANQGGQWNHWAFTKNTATGWMRIYLNGVLWWFSPGKTKLISIMNLILGKDATLSNNYKGKVNNLTIWNKEFVLADVKAIMNTPILPTHPYYSNLMAYYKLDEGTGLIVNDTKNSVTSNGTNIVWSFDRGNKLTRMFYETNVKPNIVFLQGNYSITTSTVVIKDSIPRSPNTIQQYSITSNATVTPMANDVVTLASTNNLYSAAPINVYNGDTGVLTGTIASTPQGTITITNLNYFNRNPYYIELMSFVTPYGIGLDFGMTGKTWYFDMSDYAPLLKGKRRFLMTLGGEWQEQMDIDFLFIVGTPPRNVLECNQIWQGGASWGSSTIASINNDTRYTIQSVTTNSLAQSFKMRSTITGHGAEGEFGDNGGYIDHYFNINGGPIEFSWKITRLCGANPVFPQGGTWVYDRQGWCPGQYSLLKEYDVTPYITPGSTVTLDYGCSTPTVVGGDYRYIAAHQLVSYGAANFSLDAAITDVDKPSTKVLFSRENPMCSMPAIIVQNTGSTTITSLDIDYWMNNASSKESYHWIGNLAFTDTATINLPLGNLWANGLTPSNNRFNVELKKANGSIDNYSYNNKYSSPFILPDLITDSLTIEVKTNLNPFEDSYKLVDANGNVIPGASPLTLANTVYDDNYILSGCYKLLFEDTGGDGLDWWANTSQGTGYAQLKNAQGTIIKTFNPDFGSRFEYSFSTKPYLYAGIKENELNYSTRLYPNPAHDKFQLSMMSTENAIVNVTDMLGRTFELPFTKTKENFIFDTSTLKAGVYFVKVTKDNSTCTRKLVID
ncbi:MAG TPA: LamG-like jellyroll fold domain-containing protein [Bacteroidia bacterium]|nr:LamG-like jellyroll fold domain-containing protein [Bacteroidia bacterium]